MIETRVPVAKKFRAQTAKFKNPSVPQNHISFPTKTIEPMSSDDISIEIEFSDDEIASTPLRPGTNTTSKLKPSFLSNLSAKIVDPKTAPTAKPCPVKEKLDQTISKKDDEAPSQSNPNTQKRRVEADIRADYKDYQIYMNYSCKLTITDVAFSEDSTGQRYFSLQVLELPSTHFGVLSIWGRVNEGANSEFAHYDYDLKAEALEKFKETFEEKTMNKWEQKENFSPKAGGYSLLTFGGNGPVNPEEKNLAQRRDKRRMDDKLEMIKERWYNSEGREGLGNDVMDLLR